MKRKTKIIIAVASTVVVGTVVGIVIYNKSKKDNNEEELKPLYTESKPFENIIESEDIFVYHQFDNGSLAISGEQGVSGDVELPREYKGSLIEQITPSAFKDNTNLAKVSIGYPLLINYDAFRNSSITEFILKDENALVLETPIGFSPYCFADCTELKSFYCEAYMPGIEPYMFSNCTSLEEVVFITPAVEIPDYSFQNCTSLREITIPGTVTMIAENAFEGCVNLEVVKGFNGSYAETWANENGYTWVGEDLSLQ